MSRWKAELFLRANRISPVVYGSFDPKAGTCTYRLLDGNLFELSLDDCRRIGHPRWAHLENAA